MINELEEKRRRIYDLLDEYRQPHSTDEPLEEAIAILISMGWKPERKQKKPAVGAADSLRNVVIE